MSTEGFQQKPRVCTVLDQSCYITVLKLVYPNEDKYITALEIFIPSQQQISSKSYQEPQFQDFLWLRKFLPLHLLLLIHRLQKESKPLQSYSKGSEVGRSPQMKVPWNKQQAEESAATKCCECDSPNTADNTPYLRSLYFLWRKFIFAVNLMRRKFRKLIWSLYTV